MKAAFSVNAGIQGQQNLSPGVRAARRFVVAMVQQALLDFNVPSYNYQARQWLGSPNSTRTTAANVRNSRRLTSESVRNPVENQYATRLPQEISFSSNGNGRQVNPAPSRYPNALSNLSLTFSLPLRRYRFQDGLDVADCKVTLSQFCAANLTSLCLCAAR